MRQSPPRQRRDAVRKLIEALEVPPCKCPLVRIHTRECNRKHKEDCPTPRAGAIGQCPCDRGCDCRIDLSRPPCPHALGAIHAMSPERWAAFLAANDPDEYYTPEPPSKPAACASREVRLAILEVRAAQGVGLWHPEDRFTHEDLAQVNVKESGGKGFSLGEVRKA